MPGDPISNSYQKEFASNTHAAPFFNCHYYGTWVAGSIASTTPNLQWLEADDRNPTKVRVERALRKIHGAQISSKRADRLKLKRLKHLIQHSFTIPSTERSEFVLALWRTTGDNYPARSRSRPRKDRRNSWLAVDYLIRCARPKSKKAAESQALSDECRTAGILISAAAIRRLPYRYANAQATANIMLLRAKLFPDKYDAVLREATVEWLQAESDDHPD